MQNILLSWQIAKRDLRHSFKAMWLLIICLMFGVLAMSAVGSFAQAIKNGLLNNATSLLGGDVALRTNQKPLDDGLQQWLQQYSDRSSMIVTMRAMLQNPDAEKRKLVELKAIDNAYPLYGELLLKDASGNKITVEDALYKKNESDDMPIAIASSLLTFLDVNIGDRVKLGDAFFNITAIIIAEPDVSTRAIDFGPRVILYHDYLESTALIQPGSLARFIYRLDLKDNITIDSFRDIFKEKTDDTRIIRFRSAKNPAGNVRNFIERTQLFLNLIGLTALLIGGIGVRNTISAYIRQKRYDFAVLKSIGSPLPIIYTTVTMQIMILGGIGIIAAALLGSLTPWLLQNTLSQYIRVPIATSLSFQAVIIAVLFGFLVMSLYIITPISQIRYISVKTLFRGDMFDGKPKKPLKIWAIELILFSLIALLCIAVSNNIRLALFFMVGVVGVILVFFIMALLTMQLVKRISFKNNYLLNMGMSNLNRLGTNTVNLLLSFGLGLTILVAVSVTQLNMSNYLLQSNIEDLPGFYFIDIPSDKMNNFRQDIANDSAIEEFDAVPMLRGHITKFNDTDVRDIEPDPRYAWVLRGDRGITWSRKIPENSEIIDGEWWDENYTGEQLVSIERDIAIAYGLDVGDTITVNILGRDITAKIANYRRVNWNSFNINFVLVFSPGILTTAPQTYIATVILPSDYEDNFERDMALKYPNISAVRVKEILNEAEKIVTTLALSVQIIATICLMAAFSVLVGTMIADHHRRIKESVILKMIGARRQSIITMMMSEYALLAVIAAILSFFIGNLVSYGFIDYFFNAGWQFYIGWSLFVLLPGIFVILICAYIASSRLLISKPMAILRNS